MKNKKEHPLTFFRKANEARQKLVKKSMGGPGSGPGPYVLAPTTAYWFDDPNKRAASDARFRQHAARVRDNNRDENAEIEYGRLANSYSPNGPNLDLPNEMKALNQKYPYYENFSEVPFKGGDNNKGWDKVRQDKPMKDEKYKKVGFEYMKEPEWKKKGGSVKTKRK